MRNYIIVLGAAIVMVSCKDENKSKYNTSFKIDNKDSIFFGKWRLCSYGSQTNMITANVCPEIVLNPFFGVVTTEDRFRWSVDSNKMKILYDRPMSNRILDDGTYLLRYSVKENYDEVELIDSTGTHYFLGRDH